MITCAVLLIIMGLCIWINDGMFDDLICYVGAIAAGTIFVFIILDGFMCYPKLIQKREEINILKNNIESIRDAYYRNESNSENAIINGSLTNLQQSTKLSEYLISLAGKDAAYRSQLVKAKLYRSKILYWLWWNGFLIPKTVHELE